MRVAGLLLLLCCIRAAAGNAAEYQVLARAYDELHDRDYDRAVDDFAEAIRLAPERADIRKDLAYTYLKIGENDLAREQFAEAMRLVPSDLHVALEYAFLCFEARDQVSHGNALTLKATARRVFDRIRREGDPASRATAEQAFANIDDPLASGIARWKEALAQGPETFSAHFELAELAEQRDELALAAEQYRAAWRTLPSRKGVLLDWGRVLLRMGHQEEGVAVMLAASRSGEPRTVELARALLPKRYPYVNEFRKAIEMDGRNVELRRELAYLLLQLGETDPAMRAQSEDEFRAIVALAPEDLLSNAQLAFLYLARKDVDRAMPLVRAVLAGDDDVLANRVRGALHLPPKPANPMTRAQTAPDARKMAERSFEKGYLRDALKYLKLAHDADPIDFSLMLKLGSVYNMLHDDETAVRWFALARKSDDEDVTADATKGYRALRPGVERFRTTVWSFPVFSTRWHDLFSYAQAKTELNANGSTWWRPYISVRFIGDTREKLPTNPGTSPQYLSESAFILAGGVSTRMWHNAMAWGEAGESFGYVSHHQVPDYRGGVTWSRARGANILSNEPGLFWETNDDLVYVYRFDRDTLGYTQNRIGYTPATHPLETQMFWNFNVTGDLKREYWANFAETGPGLRFHWTGTPSALTFTVAALRGTYLVNRGNPHRPNFNDIRAGFWYAITR